MLLPFQHFAMIHWLKWDITKRKQEEESLTWVIIIPRHLHEAIIERKIVTNRVLPAGLALVVEREVVCYVLIDLTESEPAISGTVYCHGNQSWIRIWWSNKFHQVFLRRQRKPAESPFCTPHSSCTKIGSLHAIGLRPSPEVGRSIQPRATEPQIRVGGWGGIVHQVTGRWQGLLWARQRWRVVEVVIVQAVLLGFLAHCVELGWQGLRQKWCHAHSSSVCCLLFFQL